LKQLDNNWKAFFNAVKHWKKASDKFLERPRPPRYKRKNGEHLLIFTNQQASIVDGFLKLPRKLGLMIKTCLADTTNLREVRFIPKGIGYVLELVYEKEVTINQLDPTRIAAIDLGVSNLVTMVNNIGKEPIIVKGGVIKSINQYYNKIRARLQSIYTKQGHKNGFKLRKLSDKRHRKIADLFHKLSRLIIDWCVTTNIGTLVIGYNDGWKQHSNNSKRNNQNFVTIPFHRLVQMLSYKAEEAGGFFLEISEAYTSKCSFLDNEPLERLTTYQGIRMNRSFFQSSSGLIIHADVNGGYNILRKVFPKAFADGTEAVGLQPTRWRLAAATS
jgi:IS605 OrfB family transposase